MHSEALGSGLRGKTAVKKGAEPEEEGCVERNEGDFCEAVSSDPCKAEDFGALLGITFRLREDFYCRVGTPPDGHVRLYFLSSSVD